jgi:hypothetical protein
MCRGLPPITRQNAKTQQTTGAGTLRRAVRSRAFAGILGGRHMECAYYFGIPGGRHMECAYYFEIPGGRHMKCAYYFRIPGVGTWNVPT